MAELPKAQELQILDVLGSVSVVTAINIKGIVRQPSSQPHSKYQHSRMTQSQTLPISRRPQVKPIID